MAVKSSVVQALHQPDWHPSLNPLLGDIRGHYATVTPTGTIKLLMPTRTLSEIELKKGDYVSSERGATRILSAESSLGFF